MTQTTPSPHLSVLLKRLKLATVERLLPELVPLAEQEGWSYRDFLERLLSGEVATRAESRLATQVARAKFPFSATIETFDFTFRSELKRQGRNHSAISPSTNDYHSKLLR